MYPEKATIKVKSLGLVVKSISWSILGRGKLSFGEALFKSVKLTHILYFSFAFFYNDDVGQPLGIVDFLDEVSSEQFIHLVHDYFVSFRSENSSSLLDRFLLRIHI